MGLWNIVVPETAQRTNLVLNPSGERDAIGYAAYNSGETIARVLTYARYGIASIACTTTATATPEGILYPGTGTSGIPVSSNQNHSFSVYVRPPSLTDFVLTVLWYTAAGAFISSSDSSPFIVDAIWNRLSLIATSPGTAAFAALIVRESGGSASIYTFHIDGMLFTSTAYMLSYFDGDQPGCRWTGLRHASTSTLDPQERGAGRERDFKTDFGLDVRFMPGAGMPPITNNLQPLALQPGALFQSSKVQPRYFDLHLSYTDTTLAAFFKKRKDLIDLLKPDRVPGDQSFLLSYSGAHASKKAYIRARYDGGAEMKAFSSDLVEQPVVRLLAEDPFFFEDTQEVAVLDFQDSMSSNNRALARVNGAWQNLGTGFNDSVRAITVDKQRGRVYFAGTFTTANGITVNGVTYWDGSTFVAMGATPGVSGGIAYALAVAPNGDVWVGGAFTSAGGTATHGIARWNIASSTWTVFALGAGSDFRALRFNAAGVLYAGGIFTNWNSSADSDYIVSYDGTTWSALGTGMNSDVYSLAIDQANNVYAGGSFTTAGGTSASRIAKWNGSAWSALGSGLNGAANALLITPSGDLFAAGTFTTAGGDSANNIALWNGSAWSALSSGLDQLAYSLAYDDEKNILYVGGAFQSAGGLTISDRYAAWNGSVWTHVDADMPGAPDGFAVAAYQSNLYLGYNTTGTATVSGRATVTNNGTTYAYPIVTLVGPSSGSMTVQWIENQSSSRRWYLNLVVQAGETVTLDTLTERVESDWRGRIYGQPLAGSDPFMLLPGANTVAAFATGTITGATVQMRWIPRHWSLDGVAA